MPTRPWSAAQRPGSGSRSPYQRAGGPPPAGLAGSWRRYALLVGLLAAVSAVPTYAVIRAGAAAISADGLPTHPRADRTRPGDRAVVVPAEPARSGSGVPGGRGRGPDGQVLPPAGTPGTSGYTSQWIWHLSGTAWHWTPIR